MGKHECRKYMGPTLQKDMLHLISALSLPHKAYYISDNCNGVTVLGYTPFIVTLA
jgi:hypothetical protein